MAEVSESNVFLTQGNEVGVDPRAAAPAAAGAGAQPSDALAAELSAGQGLGASGSSSSLTGAGGAPHASPSTRLHHKLREMKEMDDALALMKGDYAERIRLVQEGEAKFLTKQHNIVAYLKRFKLFILESDAKRARAEKKEADEQKQRAQKLREIEQSRAHFLQLQSRRSDLKARNDHYKQNRSYLELVKDSVPEQYGEIDELIVRYQILKQTNLDLSEANRQASEKMESVSAELQQLSKTKQNDILVMNSRFAHLLQKLEGVSSDTSSIENEVSAGEGRTRDMQRYFCEVQMAIRNIYARTMSSLPSKKAHSQIKKRMQQATIAAAQAAAAAAASSGNSGAHASGSNAEALAAAHSRSSTATGSSGGGAGTQGLDSDSDDDESNERASQRSAAYAASGEDLSSAALAHTQSLAHSKHATVKAHLIQLLDAISERLVDLQFIVDQVTPGGVQILREGGALYSAGSAAAAAMVGGSAGTQAMAAFQAGQGNGGGGAAGGSASDRAGRRGPAGASGRSGHSGLGDSSTADSSRRGGGSLRSVAGGKHPPPTRAAGPGSPSSGATPGKARSRALLVDDDSSAPSSNLPSPMPSAPSAAMRSVELENKMRQINAQLANSGSGLLLNLPAKTKDIPVNQSALPPQKMMLSPSAAEKRDSPRRRGSVMGGGPGPGGRQHRPSIMGGGPGLPSIAKKSPRP